MKSNFNLEQNPTGSNPRPRIKGDFDFDEAQNRCEAKGLSKVIFPMTIARSFFAEKCSRGGITHLATEKPWTWTLNWSRMVFRHNQDDISNSFVAYLRHIMAFQIFPSFNDAILNAIPLAFHNQDAALLAALVPNGHRYICMDRQVGA